VSTSRTTRKSAFEGAGKTLHTRLSEIETIHFRRFDVASVVRGYAE